MHAELKHSAHVAPAVDELKKSTNCNNTQKRIDPKLSRQVGQPSPCRQQTIVSPPRSRCW